MKLFAMFFICSMGVASVFGGVLPPYQTASVTVRVIDEEGSPISNATAVVGFSKTIPPGEGWGTRPYAVEGLTDTNGLFTAQGEGEPSISCSAKKAGYYPTWGSTIYPFTNAVLGRWQPWNPTYTVTLRKLGNPVPMYAKKVRLEMPVLNEPVGYDLLCGDWVAPHGKGEVADFIFLMNSRVAGWKDFETRLVLTFTNTLDGIQAITEKGPAGSTFQLPRSAMESGYHALWTNSIGYLPGTASFQTQAKDRPGYFFRVRSVVDEKGNLVHALYGKIKGPIQFDGRDSRTGTLSFVYYLNPTPNDRNLEFDPTKNIFTVLSSREEVRDP